MVKPPYRGPFQDVFAVYLYTYYFNYISSLPLEQLVAILQRVRNTLTNNAKNANVINMSNASQEVTQTPANHKKRAGRTRSAVVGTAAATAALLAACAPGNSGSEATPRQTATGTTTIEVTPTIKPNVEENSPAAFERTPRVVNHYAESILDPHGKFKSAARFNSATEEGETKTTIIIPAELKPGAKGDHGEYRITLTGVSNGDGLQASEVTGFQVSATRSLTDGLNVTGRENIDPVAGVAFIETDAGWDLASWGANGATTVQEFIVGPEVGTQYSGKPLSAEGFLADNARKTDQLLQAALAKAPIGNEINFR